LRKLKIIKAGSISRPESLGLKPFHFDDVTREAREVLATGRRESQEMVARARAEAEAAWQEAQGLRDAARREAEAIRETARQEGFQAGREAGFEAGSVEGRAQALADAQSEFSQHQANLVAAFRAIMDAVERGRIDWLAAARQDLVDLALAIARKVARHVGQRDREVVLANLEEAVRLVGVRSEATIAVNPADAEAARVFAQSLLDLKERWQHVQVVEEPEVSPGGCRVQWGSGSVDAALETQLDRIEAELKGE
jgi:flagellar assembly protein FliH